MRIPGAKTVKRFSRWVRARILGGALILGYHRVVQAENDVYEICVTASHFAEQLEILRKYTHPIGLAELVQHLKQGTVPRRAVCITFDDGYADILYSAQPLLEKHEIPATVFVSTDYLGRWFWWDELSWLIKSPRVLPDLLQVHIGKEDFGWRSLASNRDELINSLYIRLFLLNSNERERTINTVRDWSLAKPYDVAAGRALTVDELVKLTGGSLVNIGSHTRTHPVLPSLPLEEQRNEVCMSRKQLEEILNRPVLGLAYPNGLSTAETREIVRESGFHFACSSEPDLVRPSSNVYDLPRLWPKDTDGDDFFKSLRRWINLS